MRWSRGNDEACRKVRQARARRIERPYAKARRKASISHAICPPVACLAKEELAGGQRGLQGTATQPSHSGALDGERARSVPPVGA